MILAMTDEPITEAEKYARCYALPEYRMGAARLARATLDVESIEPGATYLDVACGRGEIVELARGRGVLAIGCELVPELCNGYAVLQGDMTDLPFPPNAFQYVSCYDAIEHLPPEQVPAALDELFRVCERVLILTTNDRPSHLGDLELHLTRRPREWWDAQLVSRAKLCSDAPVIERGTFGANDGDWHWRIEL